jgi:3-oxoacyl-[acyl-carrier protein] reductase
VERVGRVALVTAGTTGLGRAITESLVRAGYGVVATSRRSVSEVERNGSREDGQPVVVRWDSAERATDQAVVDAALFYFGRLDAVVLNAGPYHRTPVSIAETSDAVFAAMLEGNLTASFRLIRTALPVLRAGLHPRVVTVGYVGAGGALGWPQRGAYAAAKAGLAALTRTLAEEERHCGVTANMVCPSDIRAHDKIRSETSPDRPVGADVARLIGFLLDPDSDHVTGQVLELAFAPGSGPAQAGIAIPVPARQRPVGSTVHPRGWATPVRVEEARLEGDEWTYRVAMDGMTAWVGERDLSEGETP